MTYAINIDTGGTFTDGFISDETKSIRTKVETTPHDLTVGILASIDQGANTLGLTRPQLLQRTHTVRFSTTIGTNTLINRSGPKVGLLLGSSLLERLSSALSKDLPLPRDLLVSLSEETDNINPQEVSEAVHQLLEGGARILVVALGSHSNLSIREGQVRTAIAKDFPRHYLGAVPILCSNQVTLTRDDLLRVNTAVVNAYLHHDMSRVLYRVEDQLRDDGYRYPLLVATADAGTSRVAKTTALRTWGSGPAGGVAGASAYAQGLNLKCVVSLDIGGTSSDISLIKDFHWPYRVQPSIANVEVALPAVDIESIGIGGGSIAQIVDDTLVVGPKSAGAQPGPAAFGLGGDKATVTDAVSCLGILDPDHFLGGRKRLDLKAAETVVQDQLADPLDLSLTEAAWSVLDTASERIAQTIRSTIASNKEDPRNYAIFVIGGAGGYIAGQIGAAVGVSSTYVFANNPVFSAFGLSTLAISHSYEVEPGPDPTEALDELHKRALRDMEGESLDLNELVFSLEAEIESPNETGELQAVQLGNFPQDLSESIADDAASGKLHLMRLRATESTGQPQLPSTRNGDLSPIAHRLIQWRAGEMSTPVYNWDLTPDGSTIQGPAILESEDSTLVVPPDNTLNVGANGEAFFIFDGPEEAR